MKILGYIDDGIAWFVNWQSSIRMWNVLVIPLEIFTILWIILKFRTIIM